MSRTILIVGAGQAGATAAAELRRLGCGDPIILCGQENHAPYERPPLSKSALLGASAHDMQPVLPQDAYARDGIDLRLGARVTGLDVRERRAFLSDGNSIAFRACLLATGGDARQLPFLPRGTPHVHHVRTLDDAHALRRAWESPRHVVILGGGFLGLEVASSARERGHRVTLIETAGRLLERAAPPLLSEWVASQARASGITLRMGVPVTFAKSLEPGVRVELADSAVIAADLAVVAIGMVPDVALARSSGLDIHPLNGGIRVGPDCATSAQGVFAAGDCASQSHGFFGRELRLESWQNANAQAATAAAAMLGSALPSQPVPWFWTDLFGWNVQMYGEYSPALTYRVRGGIPAPEAPAKTLLLGERDGILRHAVAVNAAADLRQLKPLFECGAKVDLAALCDEGVPLRATVRAACSQPAASAARPS